MHEKENLEDLTTITIDFERLQKKMKKEIEEDNYDFSYVIEGEEYEGDFPDIETIRYLVVSDQVGTGGTSFVMDFENNIWEWDHMYSDNSEVGMASWWHLGVEFQNGSVVSYNGAGDVPDNYKILEEVLFKR